MLTTIFLNLFTGLIAFALSSGVALHDSRFDKVFAMTVTPGGDTAQHDVSQAVAHELHDHTSTQSVSDAVNADPSQRARSHRKYIALPHVRVKLSALYD